MLSPDLSSTVQHPFVFAITGVGRIPGSQNMVVYSGKSHSSFDMHKMVIRCLEDARPASKQLDDIRATTSRSREALLDGDLAGLGEAMIENTAAQKRLYPVIIDPDTIRVIQIAKEHGAIGWKSNGAGGEGGSVTILGGPKTSDKRRMIKSIEGASPCGRLLIY